MFKKKNIGWFIFAAILLLSFFTVRLFIQQGEFQTIAAQSDYNCKALESPYGPEDMFVDYDTGLLYISATPRGDQDKDGNAKGNIFTLDMNDANATIQTTGIDFGKSFKPHGISLIKLADGSKRLFAISHPEETTSVVEVFDVAGRQLTHLKTIDGLTGGLNSITAIDGERFYATQDGSQRGVSSLINAVFGLEYGEVIFYDGTKSIVASDGFSYANGLELSDDGTQLFVADTLNRVLVFFDRDVETNLLTKTGDLYMDAGVDNIRRIEDGTFYIGGHPKMFSSFFFMGGRTEIAPSVVFHAIPPKDGKGGELRVVYLEDGQLMSATSGAVKYKDKMFVASIVDNHILSCTAK